MIYRTAGKRCCRAWRPLHATGRLVRPYRRPTEKEPTCDQRVEDQTTERRCRHKGPNRAAPHVMQEVPTGVHEPRDRDRSIRTKTSVREGHGDHGKRNFPCAESAATQV